MAFAVALCVCLGQLLKNIYNYYHQIFHKSFLIKKKKKKKPVNLYTWKLPVVVQEVEAVVVLVAEDEKGTQAALKVATADYSGHYLPLRV